MTSLMVPCSCAEGQAIAEKRAAKLDPSRGAGVTARRMTLRLPDEAWKALDGLAPDGERSSLIAYLLRCEYKRQFGGAT